MPDVQRDVPQHGSGEPLHDAPSERHVGHVPPAHVPVTQLPSQGQQGPPGWAHVHTPV